MIYEIGTISTKANDPKITGKNTLWKNNVTKVSVGQIILIQAGNTIYQNSIRSVESDTQMTLSFPVPVTLSDVKYVISITMIGSVSDGVNKSTAMVTESYQLMTILNRLMTESGVIKVALPDGTEMQLRTEKERDRLLDGKFDKTGGDIEGALVVKRNGGGLRVTPNTSDGDMYLQLDEFVGKRAGFIGFGGPVTDKRLSIRNDRANTHLQIIEDGVLINGTPLMKVGAFGVGTPILLTANDNLGKITNYGNYMQAYTGLATVTNEYPIERAGTLTVTTTAGGNVLQEYRVHNSPALIYYRSISGAGTSVNTPWISQYNTGNTTKDANGNLKAASPIVKVFADHIETNDEAEGVTMQKLGTGHYLIKGVVGFNADGAWGINNGFVIPQDHNGKNMVLIDYEVRPDGDIEVFVFHQQNVDMPERFQNKRIKYIDKDGNPVYYENYEPCDVPESRWIDMRVEMPVNSIYNLKQAEAERLAKEEAERQAEEAKNAEIEAEEDI